MGALFCLRLASIIQVQEQLDCFNCNNIDDLTKCHTTTTCQNNEYCYTESYISDDGIKLFILGCRPKQFCLGLDQTDLFVGRKKRGDDSCVQCCHLHGCNKYLCPVQFTAAPPPVDGGWSKWGAWGTCGSSCGIGLQTRSRTCDNPPPSYNGRLCLGDAKDIMLCTVTCTDSPSIKPTIRDSSSGPITLIPSKTTTITVPTTTATSIYITDNLTQKPGECKKHLIDCSGYYRPEACHGIYESWGHRFCPVHCGFCPTGECKDLIDCSGYYRPEACHGIYEPWAHQYCPVSEFFCFFKKNQTKNPGECKDLIDCSGYYRPEACHGIYEPWAHRYCPVHCGFCPTVSPIPCVDTITNCDEYQNDVCTNKVFFQWRETHCRKYCKLC